MSGQEAVLQVVILRDGLLLGTEIFATGSYRLGSALGADLRLEDATVKAQHAMLYFQNGRAVVQDVSQGALFVNGRPISVCEIRPVDEIRCGPFTLKARVVPRAQVGAKAAPPPEVEALLRGGTQPAATPRPAASVSPIRPVPSQVSPPAPAQPRPIRNGKGAPQLSHLARAPTAPTKPASRPDLPLIPTAAMEHPIDVVPATIGRASVRGRKGAARKNQLRRITPAPLIASVDDPASTPRRGRGPPKLYFELCWGNARQEVRSFAWDQKHPILEGTAAKAMPLWGFSLPAEPFVVAKSVGRGYRVFLPPHAKLERWKSDGKFYPPGPKDVESDGLHSSVHLSEGNAVRLSQGRMSVIAYVAPAPAHPWTNPLKSMPWLLLSLLFLLGSGLLYFLIYGPKPPEVADFTARNVPPVALKLVTPEKKPQPEEAKKKVEEPKKPPAEKEEKRAEKRKPVPVKTAHRVVKEVKPASPPPQETKALKALAKLSAAGPATGDILAAVDKLGNGPGSKNAKNNNYKLSGLIGKAPIANAGLGTFGLGGGGRGGAGLLGSEVLRGRGGGGIGALGAGNVGRGTVAGTVTRASARTISAQGSVDREAVAKTVNAHLQEVRACYERALLKEPGLAGKVVLEWTIGTNGAVLSAKSKTSTLRNPAVESCILQDLKTWRFPPAKGGMVIVSYPFLFNSVGY